MAVDIFEHALNRKPSLVDWLDESLTNCVGLFRQTNELIPSRWAAAIQQISTTTELDKLAAKALKTPLISLAHFLQFAGQPANQLEPVYEALCKALVADAQLPADQSRLIHSARNTKYEALRGFMNGIRLIPELALVEQLIEQDRGCAEVLQIKVDSRPSVFAAVVHAQSLLATESEPNKATSVPLQLRSQIDEKIKAGIEKVLTEAWEAVSNQTSEEDRFKTARREAGEIISCLSPHIKRQVGAHFETKKWEPLKASDPKLRSHT